jgi:hypothetical protein
MSGTTWVDSDPAWPLCACFRVRDGRISDLFWAVRYSSSISSRNSVILLELFWRRGWDSNAVSSCRICNLQIPRCQDSRGCQRFRGALPDFTRRPFGSAGRIDPFRTARTVTQSIASGESQHCYLHHGVPPTPSGRSNHSWIDDQPAERRDGGRVQRGEPMDGLHEDPKYARYPSAVCRIESDAKASAGRVRPRRRRHPVRTACARCSL